MDCGATVKKGTRMGNPGRLKQFQFLFFYSDELAAVKNRLRAFALVLLCAPLLAACSNAPKLHTLELDAAQTCNGQAIKNQFIVRFLNGKWAYIKAKSRAQFIKKYIKPNLSKIDFVEPDEHIAAYQEAFSAPTGSEINNWGDAAINAQAAWQAGDRGQGIVVAVVDSGVDITHPQLKNQIDYNPGEMGLDAYGRDKRFNQIDDDGNGYVDDWAGYNFLDNNGDMYDDVGHGTHVSGIIAAEHSDTTIQTGYVQGVAPEAKILPVKFIGANGGTLSDALKSIDYAVARGAKIINASWGGPGCSQSLQQKIEDLSKENILFVAAAGNSGENLDLYPEYPAAFSAPLQLTVGAIANTFLQDSYSNYSSHLVDLFAPGTAIVSTVPPNLFPGGYASFTGTSMATPFVSGAAADLLSAGISVQKVRQLILQSVDQNPTYTNVTQGRLDLGKAIAEL